MNAIRLILAGLGADPPPEPVVRVWVDCSLTGFADVGAAVADLVVVPPWERRGEVIRALSARPELDVVVECELADRTSTREAARAAVPTARWSIGPHGRRARWDRARGLVLTRTDACTDGCFRGTWAASAKDASAVSDDDNAKTILGHGPPIDALRPRPHEEGGGAEGEEPDGERLPTGAGGDAQASGLHLSEFDWDIPDDFDPPSGIDSVMTAEGRANARRAAREAQGGSSKPKDDSLPSTSALFGSDYRGEAIRAAKADAPKRPRFDLDSQLPPDATRGFVGADLDAIAKAVAPAPGPAAVDHETETRLPIDTPVRPPESVLPVTELGATGAPAATPAPVDVDSGAGVGDDEESSSVLDVELVPILPDDASDDSPLGGTYLRGRDPSDSVSVPGGVRATPRDAGETPLVTPRLDRPTPIIASPVVAARQPTPEGLPAAAGATEVSKAGGRGPLIGLVLGGLAIAAAVAAWFLTR